MFETVTEFTFDPGQGKEKGRFLDLTKIDFTLCYILETAMPYLDSSSFLTIFVSAALVILFGTAYAGTFTLVKIERLREYMMPLAYAFWALQTYSLWVLSVSIKSDPFTLKVLMAAMVGYLIFPHIVYFLVVRTHAACESPDSH